MRRSNRRWLAALPLGAALIAAGPLDGDAAARVAWIVTVSVALLTVAVLLVPRRSPPPKRSASRPQEVDRAQRVMPVSTEGTLRILQSLRLSAQSSLYVVSFDGRELLVADGAEGPRLIARGAATQTADGRAEPGADRSRAERNVTLPRPPRASAESQARLERFRALSAGG